MKSVPGDSGIAVYEIISMCNSVLRVVATLIIFVFHCNGLYGHANGRMLLVSFALFMFLSGFYCFIGNRSSFEWIVRRLKRIYVPYWAVAALVIVSNEVFRYKSVSLVDLLVFVAGGNFFLRTNLYVIAWFVSVMILLYICMFIVSLQNKNSTKLIVTLLLSAALLSIGLPLYFLVFFFVGYSLHYLLKRAGILSVRLGCGSVNCRRLQYVHAKLRWVDGISYEFYLLHGAVLLCFYKIVHVSYASCLLVSFVLTVMGAVALAKFSNRVFLVDIRMKRAPQPIRGAAS